MKSMYEVISSIFVVAMAMLFSACMDADLLDFSTKTDIYVTNNTADELTVVAEDVGDNTRIKGQHWTQHSEKIPAYKTVKLFTLERKEDFTVGQLLLLDTTLSSSSGDSLTLQLQLSGENKNSQLRYGLFDNDL